MKRTVLGGAARNPQGGYWLVGGNGTGRDPAYPDVVLLMSGINDIFFEYLPDLHRELPGEFNNVD